MWTFTPLLDVNRAAAARSNLIARVEKATAPATPAELNPFE